MSKKSILKRAAEPEQVQQKPARRTQRGAGARDAIDLDVLASKVADALWAQLERFLPICARLAAADTLRTTEKRPTVLKRAIDEGVEAADLIQERLSHAN